MKQFKINLVCGHSRATITLHANNEKEAEEIARKRYGDIDIIWIKKCGKVKDEIN